VVRRILTLFGRSTNQSVRILFAVSESAAARRILTLFGRSTNQSVRILFAVSESSALKLRRFLSQWYALVEGNNCDLGKVEKLCLKYRVPVWHKYCWVIGLMNTMHLSPAY
jgi:hypothetical protein